MKTVIIGSPGSGKTNFARRLQTIRACEVLHLDSVWHKTDYSDLAQEQFEVDVKQFMQATANWIVDGNYLSSLPLRLEQADQVIWLKQSPYRCLYNVIKRSLTFRYDRSSRPEMPETFRECLDSDYIDFLRLVWRYSRDSEPQIRRYLESFQGEILVLRGFQDVHRFLKKEEKSYDNNPC